jgi:(1->4)-alpha-D-glucan 1-alpha-D-glucosylmutase
MRKAAREAGEATSWADPHPAYETALQRFVSALLDPAPDNLFRTDFVPFCRRVAFFGRFNALSQCLIKIAAPGIPDIYQGTELWQHALVDPDNRRPVAFEARHRALKTLESPGPDDRSLAAELLETAEDGRIKLFLITRGLAARRRFTDLFRSGRYLALEAEGALARHVVAFAREAGGQWALVVAPRFLTALVEEGRPPLGPGVWQDTVIRLPAGAAAIWQDVFTRRTLHGGETLSVGEALSHFPAALLISEEAS